MVGPIPTTRRDFLRGRRMAQAVGEILADRVVGVESSNPGRFIGQAPLCWGLEDSAPATRSESLLTVSRQAMACQFQIVLPTTIRFAVEAASAALDEIELLEDQMTVYRDTSEVSRINQLAAAMPVPVEERLFDLFEIALCLTEETEGAFDMAAGALVKCWGFFRGPRRVPIPVERTSVLERIGSQHVVLDRRCRTIEFRRPGLELNLGAIGKGYALDRAAERLRNDWNVTGALLHGGRSSVNAIGSPSDEGPDREGWLVGIAHPFETGKPIGHLRLRDAALGTSGATNQFFEANGRRFGHILDPRTGWPAEEQTCVSVIAPTAAKADALSTALFILGPDKARAYCESHPDIGAILVSPGGPNGALKTTILGRALGMIERPLTAGN